VAAKFIWQAVKDFILIQNICHHSFSACQINLAATLKSRLLMQPLSQPPKPAIISGMMHNSHPRMLTCQKHQFSLPHGITYLNCAYMAPLPKAVEAAGHKGVAAKANPFEIGPPDFFSGVENLKKLFARLVHVEDSERIAVIPSVSYGMANVVRNAHLASGQNVVMVGEVFPSNYYSWHRAAAESGAEIRMVEAPGGTTTRGADWNVRLLEAINGQTAAVSLPQVHWADGTKFDLPALRQRTREVGALLVVDGTQSVGAYPFDVREIQPDALICAGYKWLLGPYGTGMAWYGEHFDGGTPVEENWMHRLNSEDFQGLVKYQSQYKPKAHRYSVGESSQFIHVPMMAAALELLMGWGVENIQNYCSALSAPYLEELKNLGCRIEDPAYRGGHLIGVRLPAGVDLEALKSATTAANIYVSFRGNSMRIAPNLYNDAIDFERLLDVFREVADES
jgi:selenocysteine lyase/cysteine desulfurase